MTTHRTPAGGGVQALRQRIVALGSRRGSDARLAAIPASSAANESANFCTPSPPARDHVVNVDPRGGQVDEDARAIVDVPASSVSPRTSP